MILYALKASKELTTKETETHRSRQLARDSKLLYSDLTGLLDLTFTDPPVLFVFCLPPTPLFKIPVCFDLFDSWPAEDFVFLSDDPFFFFPKKCFFFLEKY